MTVLGKTQQGRMGTLVLSQFFRKYKTWNNGVHLKNWIIKNCSSLAWSTEPEWWPTCATSAPVLEPGHAWPWPCSTEAFVLLSFKCNVLKILLKYNWFTVLLVSGVQQSHIYMCVCVYIYIYIYIYMYMWYIYMTWSLCCIAEIGTTL